jgi:hypothetical protein
MNHFNCYGDHHLMYYVWLTSITTLMFALAQLPCTSLIFIRFFMVVFFLTSNGNQINVQPLHHVCEVAFPPSLAIALVQLCIVACFF